MMKLSFEDMRRVHERLTDEESRQLFDARLNYAVTGDWHDFLSMNVGKKFNLPFFKDFYQSLGKPVVVFGVGQDGKYTVRLLRQSNVNVVALCDSAAQKSPQGGAMAG